MSGLTGRCSRRTTLGSDALESIPPPLAAERQTVRSASAKAHVMHVRNVHERCFGVAPRHVGILLDRLASDDDRLWPSSRWPRMHLDRPLRVGAIGGHGPIRYEVEAYEPGRIVRFRFRAPRGFDGFHAFEVVSTGAERTTLRHVLDMTARGPALFTWPIVFRPLHDALVEDCLDGAMRTLGNAPTLRPWSLWVRVLRRCFRLLARRWAFRGAA